MIAKTISHYRILEKLGGGGMGVVYKAEDTRLKRTVALKFLPPDLTRDDEAKERFVHEAQAASALDHPNICTIYEIDETEDGQMFIAMACYEGETLKKKVASGQLAVAEAVEIATQIAQGLAKAHEHGITHRDIKPANVMITKDGVVKILDFGLAKLVGQSRLTKVGTTMGTVAYMSPEQTQGEDVDHRTDIWSFGVVLYEMLTGQLPFRGEYEAAVVYSILNEEPKPMTSLRADVPTELEQIVNRALAKEREARYQNMHEFLADLRGEKRSSLEKSPSRFTKKDNGQQHKKTRQPLRMILGIAIMLAVGCAIFFRFIFADKKDAEPRRKMIAVLPFENLGPADDKYFADGITEEIASRLAAVRELGIISRTSAVQYKKTDKTIKQIGEELGVAYVLDGTIRWDHDTEGKSRVRVIPQLIRVADDTQLWSERYERRLDDIFAVQSNIAEQVIQQLDITLLQLERRVLAAKPTENVEAYQAYLRGLDYAGRPDLSVENFQFAVQLFERAVELDTNFAKAYAELSIRYTIFYSSRDRNTRHLTKAKTNVDRALQLQPELAEAHFALGFYHLWGYMDFVRAMAEFAIAQQGLPNDTRILESMAFILERQGEFAAATDNLKKAFELNPRNARLATEIGMAYLTLRQYPEAERYFDRSIALAPDQFLAYLAKAGNYWLWEGATEKARATLTKVPEQKNPLSIYFWVWQEMLERNYQAALERLDTAHVESFEFLNWWFIPKTLPKGEIYQYLNEPKRAHTVYGAARIALEKVLKEQPDDPRIHSSLGLAYAGLGRKEEAIREGKLGVELCPISKDTWVGPERVLDLARIYVMLDDDDAALDQIEYLLSIPSRISVPMLRLDPRWNSLRAQPRFQQLSEKYSERRL